MEATVTIDGWEILKNIKKYYVPPVYFDPPIIYDPLPPPGEYQGACRVQGIAFLSMPLKPGDHVITNYVEYIIIPGEFGIIYDNTWNITVLPYGDDDDDDDD